MSRGLGGGAWLTAIALAGTLASACGDKAEIERRPQGLLPGEETPRGPTRMPATAATPAPTAAPPRSSLPSPFLDRAPDPGALTRGDAQVGTEPAAAEGAAPDAGKAPERDLASELLALMGHPARCVDLGAVARGGGRLSVTMTVHVVPSGRITRATAMAPGQPPEVLKCLEERVVAATFRGPVEGAPRVVTTTLPIEVVAQPTAPAAAPASP